MFKRMLKGYSLSVVTLFALQAQAQSCPGADEEPALKVKTDAGPVLLLCGFEEREVIPSKNRRTFTDFTVYSWAEKSPDLQKVFTSDPADTYWAHLARGQ